MKKLSFWASRHKWYTRILIVAIYVLLNALGILTGLLLFELDFLFSSAWMVFAGLLCVAAVITYPSRKDKYCKYTASAYYLQRKSRDFVLGLATFCMIMFIGNRLNTNLPFYQPVMGSAYSSTTTPADSVTRQYKTIAEFSASMKNKEGKSLKWKEKKKLLKKQVSAIKNDDELSDGAKFLLIFLSCAVATGLMILLAALACEISCAGSEALAILVMMLGTGLIVFLLIRLIKRILGKTKKKEVKPAEPAEQ